MTYQEIVRRRCLRVLNVVGRIIGASIQAIATQLFTYNLIKPKDKNISMKNILYIFVIAIMILLTYDVEYSAINPIVIFISIVFCLSYLYKSSISKACFCAGVFMITLFLFDMLATFILINFVDIEIIRNNSAYLIFSNLAVSVCTIIFIKIKLVKESLTKFIEICEKRKNLEIIAFISLLIVSLSIILYMISQNYVLNEYFMLNIVGIMMLLMLTLIFFKEKYDKEIVISNYDQLFEYVKTFEEWIDNENVNIHESKNQLATLRDMVKNNKKAVNYIDNIINETMDLKSTNNGKLKYIPKGGLKGLLLYKITIAEKYNISLLVDVSPNVSSALNKLNVEEIKILCRLVGIFFDNAIEAAVESEDRKMTCEIYISKKVLNIVITNSYGGKIEINKIGNKNYSTKGVNRGKGLYLANKFSQKAKIFQLENRVINDFYVQKILVNKN